MRAELARSHALLEQRVADRTAELSRAAEQLRAEVHERKQAEERLTILVQELAHRVKNLLSVFQSITARTLTGGRSIEDAREILIGRLQSLGHAHELLTEASWHGAELRDVVHGGDRRLFGARADCRAPLSNSARPACRHSRSSCTSSVPTPPSTARFRTQAARWSCNWTLGGTGTAGYMDFSWKEHGGPPVEACLARGLRPVPDHGNGKQSDRRAGHRFCPGGLRLHAYGYRSIPSGPTATTAFPPASPPASQRRKRRRPL